MSDEHGLLWSVLTDPADDVPRLVYADWLEENGQADRAEGIRLSIELGHPQAYQAGPQFARMQERLLDLHARRDDWLPPCIVEMVRRDRKAASNRRGRNRPVSLSGVGYVWNRGFVERIEMPLSGFVTHAAEIFASHPVTSVRLTDTVWPTYATRTHQDGRVESDAEFELPMPTDPTVFKRLADLMQFAQPLKWGSVRCERGVTTARFGGFPGTLNALLVNYGRLQAGLPPMPSASIVAPA